MKFQFLFLFSLFLWTDCLHGQTITDVEKVRSRLYSLSFESAVENDTSANKTDALLNGMDALGRWNDINYQNKSAAKWQPAQHWQRLLSLTANYKNQKSKYYNNPAVRQLIFKGIGLWLKGPPVASNYWWNAIGVPNIMGKVYILLQTELPDSLLTVGVGLLKLGTKPDHYEYYGKATGQNLLWLASAHLYAACITSDVEGMKRVFASVADEIRITDGEGIQPDYSFYQHGKQNYAMGYGKGFTESAVQYFYLANGTAFQFPQNKVDIISHYILDGQQWMTRYKYLEYTAMGREIARQGNDGKPILKALQWMMDIDPLRRDGYAAFYRRLSGDEQELPLVGNRYFRRSDLMVHQRKGYYFSLKAASNRIASSETGNGENLKGFYQGNGTYYLIKTGNEHKDIFPVWDWRKIPGLLTRQTTDTFPLITWGVGAEGATAFVYGISDSLYGCFGYDYKKDDVTAHRSWFFFDDEIVHLASNVTGDSVYQSINQCLLNGDVWQTNGDKKEQKIFHDSVGYCINNGSYNVTVSKGLQAGSWKSINVGSSDAIVSKKVFSLGINLGNHVTNGSFSYTILPAVSMDEFKTYRSGDHVAILKNEESVQGVWQKNNDIVQAVFYKQGTLALPWNRLSISMKQPGLLLIKSRKNKLVIDYSQPVEKKHVEINVNDKTSFQNDELAITILQQHSDTK